MKALISELIEFRNKRDWDVFHTPENLAKSISIEAAELLELFQWGKPYSPADLEDELADVFIYALYLADKAGLDPEEIIRNKIKVNESRFPVVK